MRIRLEHVKNVDLICGQGDSSGYWCEPVDPEELYLFVESLRDASMILREWVTRNGLGGGNMARCCGEVTEDNRVIAKVSYNGRVWTPEGWPDCTELVA